MYHWDCVNGCDIDYGLVDGYCVGDRLLEGVLFQCRKDDDDDWHVQIDPDSEDYFGLLDAERWLAEIREYCTRNDVWECPNCGCDVYPTDVA